jgi:hypothetical protein
MIAKKQCIGSSPRTRAYSKLHTGTKLLLNIHRVLVGDQLGELLDAAALRTTAVADELAEQLRRRPVVLAARNPRSGVRLLDLYGNGEYTGPTSATTSSPS